jgi:hypothetical protein
MMIALQWQYDPESPGLEYCDAHFADCDDLTPLEMRQRLGWVSILQPGCQYRGAWLFWSCPVWVLS